MGALDTPVASPCISVCVLDPRGAVCTGCGRTLDEIAAWVDMDNDVRRAVLTRLPARLAGLRGRAAAGSAKPNDGGRADDDA